MKRIIIVIFFISIFYTNSHSQTETEWNWVNQHFDSVSEELFPVENNSYGSISYRSYRDLFTEEAENFFAITNDRKDDKIVARLKMPEGKSIYEQIMYWHRKNPSETIDDIKKKLKVKETILEANNCPEIEDRYYEFYQSVLPQFAENERKSKVKAGKNDKKEVVVVLHPRVHTIFADITGGDLKIIDTDDDGLFAKWASRTHKILTNCESKK